MNTKISTVGNSFSFLSTVPVTAWHRFAYKVIGNEIGRVARHADRFVQAFPLPHDSGLLYHCVKTDAAKSVVTDEITDNQTDFSAVLLNGNLNYESDAQTCLTRTKALLSRDSRLFVVSYNPYIKPLFNFMTSVGLRKGPYPQNFLTKSSLASIARLAGFEVVRTVPVLQFPFRLLGLGNLINACLGAIPVVRWLGAATVSVLRPLKKSAQAPVLTIVVPVRNEKGNLPTIFNEIDELKEIPKEVLFVEGNSTDGTWEALNEMIATRKCDYAVRAIKQKGKGKKDASLLGLAEAKGDVLTILDGDMTVTAKELGGFYHAYCDGLADFVNGSRLVYTMEKEAMRPLNLLGNVFFAKALSFVLETKLSDTLCGSKLFSRAHFRAIMRWNKAFGDFDPFGDFALLFAASSLGLSVVDVPVHYLARRYGTTNISRFRDGFQLLRMTTIGFFRLRLGRS